MKFSLFLLSSVVVLVGCSSTPEPVGADDNIMFMGMDIQQPDSESTKKLTSQEQQRNKTVNTAKLENENELANNPRALQKEVTVKVDSENDIIVIKKDANRQIKEWQLKGAQNLHSNQIDAIVKQAPEADRKELEEILTNIDLKPHSKQTIDDNIMFMDTTEQRYVIKEIVEAETKQMASSSKSLPRQSNSEPLTTIIIDLIKTANLSDQDKDKIRKALNMN